MQLERERKHYPHKSPVLPKQFSSASGCYFVLVATPFTFIGLKSAKAKNLSGINVSHLGLAQKLLKNINQEKKIKKNPTSPPKNVETSGKCQSITAKKNEDQFSFLPQVISPASGQWWEISPKVPAIHHTQTHTHTSRALEQECRKIVFTKWNLTISMVFPSSEAERKPKAGLNIHRVVFQLYISIVKHYRRQNRASRALQTS